MELRNLYNYPLLLTNITSFRPCRLFGLGLNGVSLQEYLPIYFSTLPTANYVIMVCFGCGLVPIRPIFLTGF